MKQRLVAFIKNPTSIHVIINTFGNYLNVAFSLVFVLILTRIFTRAEYGIFNVLFSIAYVLANILDFGTTATIYSYLPPLLGKNRDALYRFIKSTFVYQSVFAFLVITILLVSFPYLDSVFFKTYAPIYTLYITAFSVLLFIWQNFISNIMFAAKKFFSANLYLTLANMIKTLIVIVLAFTNNVTIGSVIFVFGVVGPVFFFLFLFIERRESIKVLMKADIHREELRFDYTLTYFIASQFYAIATRMDLFLLSFFNMKAEAGDYSLAQKIILTIITTIVSITQVLSPGFSNVTNKKEAKLQFKTGLLYMLLPSSLFAILFFIPAQVYGLLFTPKFMQAAPIAQAMSLSFILNALSSIPMLFLLYTIKKPRYILITNILTFAIMSLGCYYLIPRYGVMGPPYALFLVFFISTIILTVGSIYEYQKLPK